VLNQKGSPAWFSDTFANIPTAGYIGRMFISIDTYAFYRDTGTGWDLIGGPGIGTLTGSGATGQVSFFNGTQVLTGNNNLFWDNTNSRLGINTATPGQALDIHSTTNTLVQLNNTTTADSVIAFQNQNVTKWKIGNVYNAGANSFSITNPILSSTPFTISSGDAITLNSNVTTTGAQLVQNGLYLTNAQAGSQAFYTNMWGRDDGINFGLRNGTGGASFIFQTPGYAYTFPASAGTLALTSNLSSYLPLAGGTLTGALIGTSAAFTGEISTSGGQLAFSGSGGSPSTGIGIRYNGTFYLYPGANGLNVRNSANNANTLVLSDSGNLTINGGGSPAQLTLGLNFYILNDQSPEIVSFVASSGSSIFRWMQNTTTEVMRIGSGGNILFGTTGVPNGTSIYGSAFVPVSLGRVRLAMASSTTGSVEIAQFFNPNGQVGNISTNGLITVYGTSSDYRLKKDIEPMQNALSKVNLLKPSIWKWKDNNNGQGFIAHELQEVFPEAVSGQKDGYDEEGKIQYQSVDASFIVATLTAAIQELNEKLVRNNIN